MSGNHLKQYVILILTLVISFLMVQKLKGTGERISFSPTPAIPLTSIDPYANLVENINYISASYYMTTIDPSASYSIGYNLGQQLLSMNGDQNEAVILDYGDPKYQSPNYGTSLYNDTGFTPLNDIMVSVEQVALGFFVGTGSDNTDHLTIIVGTNNHGPYITYAHGQQWAIMVNGLVSYAIGVTQGMVSVYGGSDLELNYNGPVITKNWVLGYNFYNTMLYNFGSAEGCPQVRNGNQSGPCANGWYQEDVYQISSTNIQTYNGVHYFYYVRPLPEIYTLAEESAKQWYSVSGYAYSRYGTKLDFLGSLTEYAACKQKGTCITTANYNNPLIGDQQLYKWLNSSSDTAQTLQWSTDISWYPTS
jgi:hypothetical protein